MRLNDFRESKQLSEKLENWLGNYGASAARQLGNRFKGDTEGEMSVADKMGKDRFINDFVAKAYGTLNSEIASGRVDPNMASPAAPAATPAEPPATEPAAPTATTPATPKVAPGNAAAPGAAQKQTTQNINSYIQKISSEINKEPERNKKVALTKELINFMADRKDYPEWGNAMGTAKSILQKNQAGGNMLRALQSGQRVSEAWNVYWINKLLESVNLSWTDVGLTLLNETKKNGKYIIAETKYYKLNNIFESVLTEAESNQQFLQRWTPTYMRGVKQTYTTSQNLMKKVQDTYATDKGKAAMTQLANAAYAASLAPGYSGDEAPAAAGPAADASATTAPASTSTAPASTGTSVDKLVSNINNGLMSLKKVDPAMYAEIIKKIAAGQSLTGLPTAPAAAPAAAPAPAAPAAPVSESRRRIRR